MSVIDQATFEELKQMSGEDFINELIDTFLEDAPKMIAEIKSAWKEKDADTFRRALNAGVKIAFGTDVGGFDWGIDPAVEFPLMVKYGMTPAQAIRSATMSAAELLGMQDDVGTVAAGKFADIVAVKGDPLSDISLLQKIDFVMKGGEVYKSPTH